MGGSDLYHVCLGSQWSWDGGNSRRHLHHWHILCGDRADRHHHLHSSPLVFRAPDLVLGKEYGFTTPGDLLGEYYQSDIIRMYTVIASLVYNIAYIVAQLLAGGIL